MSFRAMVERDGPNRYVLPKIGRMKTEVVAYLSERLFEHTTEELWRQAAMSASYEGAIGMYLMPDTHLGYSIPVGGVLVTEDTIVQAGSGYDIGCGVVCLQVKGLHASDVADWGLRERWVRAVERWIAFGVGKGAGVFRGEIGDVFRYGVRALGVSGAMRDRCERDFIEVSREFDERRVEGAVNVAPGQLGSVGSGNHFVEMQVDRDDGSVWVTVHCGSRGYGWKTADYYYRKGAELRGLEMRRRELSWLRADEELGKEYWAHHNSAANYAIANRWVIVEGVRKATQDVFGKDVEPFYEISHNLVQEETLILPDGSTKRGFVHRKGATRAFAAGHPDLIGTRWENTGHPCIIPGSMYHGAAILFPGENADKTCFSVNHGSGRVLGRNEAKRVLGELQEEIDREMSEVSRTFDGVEIKGIVGNGEKTPLDECGHAYKNLDEVIRVLQEEGVATVWRRMYPVANIKGDV